jgi:hypothetical protein
MRHMRFVICGGRWRRGGGRRGGEDHLSAVAQQVHRTSRSKMKVPLVIALSLLPHVKHKEVAEGLENSMVELRCEGWYHHPE